jgi:hypothetical protein
LIAFHFGFESFDDMLKRDYSQCIYSVEAKAKKIHTEHIPYISYLWETVSSSCSSTEELIVLMASCPIYTARRLNNQVYS